MVDWLPVFATPACCDLLAESLAFCREHKALRLYAWVPSLPSSSLVTSMVLRSCASRACGKGIHLTIPRGEAELRGMVACPSWSLGTRVKFTAQRWLALMEREGRNWLLELPARAKAAHKHRRRFQLWLAFEERYGGSL